MLFASKRSRFATFLLFLLLILSTGFKTVYASDKEGRLIKCTFIREYSPEEVRNFQGMLLDVHGKKKDLIAEKGGLPDSDVCGVKTYLIEYETPNYDGKHVRASGLLVVPSSVRDVYPVVAFMHGTILINGYAPSNFEKSSEGITAAVMFAAKGYVLIMPDYIGCGKSKIMHPYFHAETEASASADMIKASFDACKEMGIKLRQGIYITGFSQGGQAAMALHRLIEQKHLKGITISAVAPISGPYSLTIMWDSWIKKPCSLSCILALKMIIAYNAIYDMKLDYNKVFLKPYSKTCVALNRDVEAGRYLTLDEILALVPFRMQNFLTKGFIGSASDRNSTFSRSMKVNETCNWKPYAPIKLYYCRDDEIVPTEETFYALKRLKKLGARNIETVDAGSGLSHVEALMPAMKIVRDWFDSINK